MRMGIGWGGVGGLTTLMCGGVHDVGDGVGWGGWANNGGVHADGYGVGWGGWANNVGVWWRSCCWGWGGVVGRTTLMCGGVHDVGDGVGWGGVGGLTQRHRGSDCTRERPAPTPQHDWTDAPYHVSCFPASLEAVARRAWPVQCLAVAWRV